ncbi:MAG: hypothetical protein OXC83_05090 [Chloroflexi bacterium]|nr:hypothetical protein [Chloroflexota bacterium]
MTNSPVIPALPYVIPAHAGIQRKAKHAISLPAAPLWIPAFAGMTVGWCGNDEGLARQ